MQNVSSPSLAHSPHLLTCEKNSYTRLPFLDSFTMGSFFPIENLYAIKSLVNDELDEERPVGECRLNCSTSVFIIDDEVGVV